MPPATNDEEPPPESSEPRTPGQTGAGKQPAPTADKKDSAGSSHTKGQSDNGASTDPSTPKPAKGKDKPAGTTPQSAPARAAGSGDAAARPRANSAKPQPTLLGDFLLGRPSPARVAAARRKTLDAAAVKAELREQMRQAAVRKLPQPGGVRDRVRKWQQTNAEAVESGDPFETPSEPTELDFDLDDESVTEEDRLRIKNRRQSVHSKKANGDGDVSTTKSPATEKSAEKSKSGYEKSRDGQGSGRSGNSAGDKDAGAKSSSAAKKSPGVKKAPATKKASPAKNTPEAENSPEPQRPKSPPKRRIVSDEHWRRQQALKNQQQQQRSPAGARNGGGPVNKFPKQFLQQPVQNSTVKDRVKDWAKKVEIPEPPKPEKYTPKPKHMTVKVAVEEGLSGAKTGDDGIRVKAVRPSDDGIRVRGIPDEDGGIRVKAIREDDGIRVCAVGPDENGIRVKPFLPKRAQAKPETDGTTTPTNKTPTRPNGVRTASVKKGSGEGPQEPSFLKRPSSSGGTRVRSARQAPVDERTERPSSSKTTSAIPSTVQEQSLHSTEDIAEPYTPTRKPRALRDPKRRPKDAAKQTSFTETQATPRSQTEDVTRSEEASLSEESCITSSGSLSYESVSQRSRSESDRRSVGKSTAPQKSLADIPVGFSAFSELDLPAAATVKPPKATKVQHSPSFKGMPNVFKKVVSEGKKIIQERVDPPKPVANRPPSIEKWLSSTIDPFMGSQKSKEGSPEDDVQDLPPSESHPKAAKDKTRSSAVKQETKTKKFQPEVRDEAKETSHPEVPEEADEDTIPDDVEESKESHSNPSWEEHEIQEYEFQGNFEDQENTDPKIHEEKDDAKTPRPKKSSPSRSTGLKRSRATRSTSSPFTTGASKPFRKFFQDAFRGESHGHQLPPTTYQSFENREYESPSEDDDQTERFESRRRSSGSLKRSPSPGSQFTEDKESSVHALSSVSAESSKSPGPGLPRAPPPTNGVHELSTIVSEELSSIPETDALSSISQTTVTQTTGLTKSTDISRQKSQRPGLKRRLTKHSDLVSELSLPNDGDIRPKRRSSRSTRSLRRKTSKPNSATADDLLREFSEDEDLYQRELKTLVDGVVPVLLKQVVNGNKRASVSLFGPESGADKTDSMSRAVINMGVVLEKLKNFHKGVPLSDLRDTVIWLDSVCSIYDNYLDVWRLGFQGVAVNLAPADDSLDDLDSLVDAMPRNKDGDVLDYNGDRVDVAHLLKRPLVRIRYLLKLARGARAVLGSTDSQEFMLEQFERLQIKARQRFKEELARKADDDASHTDTTRTRDLRSLGPLEGVIIDPTRQVNAKDWFSLDLAHSSGQRLECQVELIFRDKIQDANDKGDILVREIDARGRSWLLFPPVPAALISARKGKEPKTLVLMVRGKHNGHEWYELLTVATDCCESVDEWLDMLGTSPRPPMRPQSAIERQPPPSPRSVEGEIPVGERKFKGEARASPSSSRGSTPTPITAVERASPSTPSRPRSHKAGSQSSTPQPSSPAESDSDASDKTPTQSGYRQPAEDEELPDTASRPLREDMRPDPETLKTSPNSTSFREDGAPPPPAHRSLGSKKPASGELAPPSAHFTIKRRTSSPLKHEYHPSDVSSTSDDSGSESEFSESETASSGDELDEGDDEDGLPESHLGISIKDQRMPQEEEMPQEEAPEEAEDPNKDLIQAAPQPQRSASARNYVVRLIASISYWSNTRGAWKDLTHEACSIIITPGLIEAYRVKVAHPQRNGDLATNDTDDERRPLIALDLTPLVMIRQSTIIDIEISSPARSYSKMNNLDTRSFRFRTPSSSEGHTMYMMVHQSRMDNAKFKALEEEARFRSFGQPQPPAEEDGNSGSSRRKSWFGRRNSYRASTRAPSQSQGSSFSGISANSLFKRLTRGANQSFNIDKSFVDKQIRPGSGGGGSLYTSTASSSGAVTPLRSPSVSIADGSSRMSKVLGSDRIKIRLHYLVSTRKWEDLGTCNLQITRPPPGVHQESRVSRGLEKRVIVTTIAKKEKDKPIILVDEVVGSDCFQHLGSRGICLNVWQDLRDENNNVGTPPAQGGVSARTNKWCFQCTSTTVANWVWGLVSQEVDIG